MDIERSAGILSHINRLHSDYGRAMDTPGQWFQIQLEQREWQYHKQIIVSDDDDTRKIIISLPLPPFVLKVSSEWYWPLRNEIIDFTFSIRIERITNLNDKCSYTRSATPSYKCDKSSRATGRRYNSYRLGKSSTHIPVRKLS